MSGAGGEEVGRISVRVVPELGQFRAEMTAALEKYDTLRVKVLVDGIAKAKSDIESAAKDQTAKINVEGDGRAARAKIKADVSGIKAKVDVDLDDDVILDRFQRRLLGEVQRTFSQIEPKLTLDVDGEATRRKFEQIEGKLVDSINLKVPVSLEEASDFRQEIQRLSDKAKLIERSIGRELKFDPIQFDDASINRFETRVRNFLNTVDREAADAAFRWDNSLRKFRTAVENDRIKIKVDVDGDRLLYQIGKLTKEARERAANDAAYNLMTKDPRFFAVDNLGGKDPLLKFRADVDFAQAEAQKIAWEERNKTFAVQAKIKPDADMNGFARAKFAIEALFGNIKVKIKESKWTAADLLPSALAGGLEEAAKGMTKVGSSAGASLPSLFSFAGMLMVVVAAIAILLPPLLALSAGFITLIPAFGALLVPIGAIALGLDGIKKAATTAGLFDDTNGAKKGGGSLGASLDAIKQKVSDTFEKGLVPAFENIKSMFADTGFQDLFANVAGGLSDMATGFTQAVTQGKGFEAVKNIIKNVGDGLSAAAPGVEKFTQGILTLISGISNKFPGLGKWFSELGDKFATNMINFTTPGIDGMSRLDKLISGVRNGIEGLTGIFQAFWNQGFKDIQDPSFGQHMLDFFNDIKSFVTNTLPTLSQGFENLASFINTLTAPFEKMGKVLDLINKIPGIGVAKNAISALFPQFEIVDKLNDVVTADPVQTKNAGKQAGVNFTDGLLAGVDIGTTNGTAITDAIGGQLKNVVGATKDQQITALKNVFQGGGVTEAVKGQISDQLTGVVGAVESKMGELAPALQTAINAAVTPLQELPGKVTTAFDQVPGAVTAAFGLIVLNVGSQALKVTQSVSQAFTGIPAAVSTGLAGIAGAITTSFNPAKTAVQQATTDMTNTVANANGQMTAATITMFNGMPTAIAGTMGGAIQVVSSMCQGMVNTALAFAGAMEQSGRAIGASFAKGIASSTDLVIGAAQGLLGAARAFFPNSPADTGPFSGAGWVDKSGEAVSKGFADGIDSGMGKVVAIARELMQAIKDVFGSAEGLTLNFNFGGASSQLDNLSSNVQGAAKSINSNANTLKPGKLSAATKEQVDQLGIQKEQLDVQAAQLRAQKNLTADKGQKAAIQQQLDQIAIQRNQLDLQGKQLAYQDKYEGSVGETKDLWEGMNEKILDGISTVGQGVLNSYTADLGISGNGALQAVAGYGQQLASNTVINVLNVADALAAQKRQTDVAALSFS